jgi:hypothetical protein
MNVNIYFTNNIQGRKFFGINCGFVVLWSDVSFKETGGFRPVEVALLLFTFGELVLWIKGLFITVSELDLLLVF